MTLVPDSTEWCNVDDNSTQDQDAFTFGLDTYAQHWMEQKMDDVEVNKISATDFGPFAHALGTGGNESLSITSLDVQSDPGLPGDYSQWSQFQTPMENINCQDSDAKSSFGSEYNFTVQESVDNANHIFEADMINDWQYSDFEDESAGRRISNSQDAIRRLDENQPFNPGPGHLFTEFHSAASQDNGANLEHRIDASSAIEPRLWPSLPDASLSSETPPRRSMRRSNPSARRPHAQPKSHLCDRCSSTFSRAGDLRRHYKVHFPDHRPFHCRIEGCSRNGQMGFYRRDKFRDHQRQAHNFDGENGLVLLEGVGGCKNL